MTKISYNSIKTLHVPWSNHAQVVAFWSHPSSCNSGICKFDLRASYNTSSRSELSPIYRRTQIRRLGNTNDEDTPQSRHFMFWQLLINGVAAMLSLIRAFSYHEFLCTGLGIERDNLWTIIFIANFWLWSYMSRLKWCIQAEYFSQVNLAGQHRLWHLPFHFLWFTWHPSNLYFYALC